MIEPTGGTAADVVTTQMVVSAVMVYVMEWVKKSQWFPWLSTETRVINRWVGLAVAVLTAIGIHMEFNYTPDGILSIVVSGLTFATVGHAMLDVARSWVTQQVLYDVTRPKVIQQAGEQ